MPWHAVPAPSSAIESAEALASESWRLAVGDLHGPLAGLPPPHAEGGVLLVGGDDVDRLGGRIPGSAGGIVVDRDRVRRARVLDPHGVLGFDRDSPGSPSTTGRARRLRDSSTGRHRRRWNRCCRGSGAPPVTAECGTLPEQTSLRAAAPAGGTTSTVSSNLVVAARAAGSSEAQQPQRAGRDPCSGQHRAPRLVGPRRVHAALDALLPGSARCSRRLPSEKYPASGKSNPSPRDRLRISRFGGRRLESVLRGHSSAGRASGLHPGGRGFESRWLHCHRERRQVAVILCVSCACLLAVSRRSQPQVHHRPSGCRARVAGT